MLSFRRALVLSTILISTLAEPIRDHSDERSNWEKFSSLLDTVDEGALHRVLHAVYPQFQDGIFSKDRTAVEQVHSRDPTMASKLVHIAKRQQDNSTTTQPPPTPSTPEQSSQVAESSSRAASVNSVLSSALSQEITASSVPPPTSVFVAPSAPTSATPISTGSGIVVYSTQGGGVVTLTSSAVNVRFTPSTSTSLYYTTLPDGTVQTRTSLIVVNAPVTETADATGAAGVATTSGAGLQNGAVKVATGGLLGAILGAVGFLAAL